MRLKGIVRNHRWTTGQIRGLGALWPSVERPLADTLASIGPGASRGCPLGSHTNAQQDTSLLLQRDFATKAEEYDLITGDDQLARIDGHDAKGFLVNKIYLPGAVLCSGRLTTLWAVQGFSSIDRESLSILMLMRPPPDLLLLGCGERMQPAPMEIHKWLADRGVALECLSTANAASTFNILNQEGRAVVGAFLPSN